MYTAIYVGGPRDGERITVGEPNHPPPFIDVIFPPPFDLFKATLDNHESYGPPTTMRYGLVGTLDIYDSIGIYTPNGEPLSIERTGQIIADEGLRTLLRVARSMRHEDELRRDCLEYAHNLLGYAEVDAELTHDMYRAWYVAPPVEAPHEAFMSSDAMTITFEGAYATAEEEMEEWQKILHPNRSGE